VTDPRSSGPGTEQPGGEGKQTGHTEPGQGEPEAKRSGRSGTRQMAAAYQGAVEAVLSVVIAAGAGYWADGFFGTTPTLFLLGLLLGFSAFCLRLWRLRDLMSGSDDAGDGPSERK